MGKRGGKQKGPVVTSGHQSGISLREESSGKKQTKGGSNNVKSILKLQHLQKLAVWASGKASIPSLGAFFGHRLASCGEAMGIPPDPSLFPCQRCETILQPGYNCTVRIEKNRAKMRRRRKKPTISTQSNVVYKCHFCSHRNLKRGTPKGHIKNIMPPKAKSSLQLETANSMNQKSASLEKDMRNKVEGNNSDEIASSTILCEIPITDSPATPLVRTGTTLLESKKRKRNRSGSNKVVTSEGDSAEMDTEKTVGALSKRKRKSWTSLKEIAESSEHDSSRNISNLTIPFFI